MFLYKIKTLGLRINLTSFMMKRKLLCTHSLLWGDILYMKVDFKILNIGCFAFFIKIVFEIVRYAGLVNTIQMSKTVVCQVVCVL